MPQNAVYFEIFLWALSSRAKISKSARGKHQIECTTQTVVCQAKNKSFFDEPLRREGAKGYNIMEPRITRITQIIAIFGWEFL